MVPRSCSYRTTPKHYFSITVLDSWCDVLMHLNAPDQQTAKTTALKEVAAAAKPLNSYGHSKCVLSFICRTPTK